MRPESFLAVAEDLVRAATPAHCRSAISRAYYAVYNVGERFLERMSFHRPKTDYHKVLRLRLMASDDPDVAQVGAELGELHERRVHADYQMDNHKPEELKNAEAALAVARSMIEVLEGCPINGERWKKIQESIAKVNITGMDKRK